MERIGCTSSGHLMLVIGSPRATQDLCGASHILNAQYIATVRGGGGMCGAFKDINFLYKMYDADAMLERKGDSAKWRTDSEGDRQAKSKFVDICKQAKTVIFVEKMDAVGRQRGAGFAERNDPRKSFFADSVGGRKLFPTPLDQVISSPFLV